MPPDLLRDMREWTAEVFETNTVDPRLRYQGSDIHVMPTRAWPHGDKKAVPLGHTQLTHHNLIERMNDMPLQKEAARLIGLEDPRPGNGNRAYGEAVVQLLSKPPNGPPLYWHQDWTGWNSPLSATPWPQVVFFSYYLTDTNRENGCLRIIPGSHLKHHELHDLLPNAHEKEIQTLENLDSPVFRNAEGSVDVPLKAGDLIIGDSRLLHSAWPNRTAQRRTLSLAWYNVFHASRPPSWWTGPIPQEVLDAWANKTKIRYGLSRTANVPWRPRGQDFKAKWGPRYLSIQEEARAKL
eukprot:gnl/TRDRNA2_/TRDRNA2_35278_c0_seq1.p1 gnl/TRDRNA2_/TRDRNA2_35278_c0~~gnl/TRDRNA2_/TRDRNA2_35278_c0_seq1.p1  ORF type:complete len:333 (-),score=47.91 gnl/TRDRNA2_/TRDRNA2_35278_c0_seq1:220-1104(-)